MPAHNNDRLAPALTASLLMFLVFLHGGALAAPFHFTPSPPTEFSDIVVNTTTAPGNSNSPSSLVSIDIAPPGPLELTDFAAMHQTSFQSLLDAGGALVESFVAFFRRIVPYTPPPIASSV